ncbi:bis(5'-nucleosyl)-tetraphosphatase (symmetrical) YqeK [Leptospira sp. 2 VSF19]|uniref:bis(5'-nucleosyl)-tetraphosphatase (symmetrical) n=1 Tax=Leptospira soteropolitanensis TaxID=2950025 RepID=A0AAW5VJA5_9LEPT|nr:bis(5'-nucleosyl)-tetraphosphatase (symmetrical) YqeK [Leptospira soteropolitanensis]MCW7492107.1 bis(5'-nucleosyl)-tetraphosphatase (symmetrical) YqeK [Leptospira soteropolitanensis]MCW7499689.1 bis(5'-nucleosyl)-tetraphosphatase (symmetrical) YqeK [Leptospira soteropolitanensis]MCW7521940.1 bis(5'-nucleosyl)-tetraphosphatase (symmetrical) YqeK [Leptospira soteropolitanensis]MCW7525794.1 bis(5'-nucleosyl)-tetraphosphatase (symmetrical) YqeK [Leptospira soteropolitanensis]MCW7530092.1 bis(5
MNQIPKSNNSLDDWILFFSEEVPKHVTETRYAHILRVANYAEDLAKKHGYENPKKAYLAGLCHDITKQKKLEIHWGLFQEFSLDVKGVPSQALHAYSAPLWLEKEYHFFDPEITKAISSHTLGNESPTLLDRIVYASDFLGSDYAFRKPELSLWVEKTMENLNYGVFMKAFQTISFLMEKQEVIHPYTFQMYNLSANLIKENQIDVT